MKVQLDRIDLTTNSRNTLAALIRLLAPHVPYSLHLLGIILNASSRASTLQDVDPSKISLWSTTPLHSDVTSTDPPALFSVVIFSHASHQFCVFCSSDSSAPSDPPTVAEKTHIRQVIEHLRDMASQARPAYDSFLTALKTLVLPTRRVDGDLPMIVVGGVHPKWVDVLAPMTTAQNPIVRHVLPPGMFKFVGERSLLATLGGDGPGRETVVLEASQIRESDLPFVHGASPVLRTDAYLLSRAPYSVCFRDDGRPVACMLMHSDGSIGALRVDERYQGQGLGKLVVWTLIERLDFDEGQGQASDDGRDLGGGALGWNWTETAAGNEAGNRFLTSMVGEENRWTCHWTSNVSLDPVDLTANSRNTLVALVRLLSPHVPRSLHVLGTLFNTGRRTNSFQDVDPSKVSLWSTKSFDAHPPAFFSIVVFSHVNHVFYVFCSGETRMSTDVERTHIKQVFEHLRDMASRARPTYDTILNPFSKAGLAHRIDTDPLRILVGAVHEMWADILAPMSVRQNPYIHYVLPPGSFDTRARWRGSWVENQLAVAVEVSQIRASDLPFVHGASLTPRMDAYILSRTPYSMCLRADGGRPVACALMHCDGSIGAVRVDERYQGQGLGRLALCALMDTLDFSQHQGQGDLGPIAADQRDLGRGAFGWNWSVTGLHNEAANRLFASMVGQEGWWKCHWTYSDC